MKTPLNSILLVLLASFLGSFGAVLLKAGATHLHFNLRSLVSNWRLALGVFTFVGSSYFFVLGVRHGELTVLYPMVALGYLWTMIWSRIFFGEPLTRRKLAGLGLILCGITILNLGNR
jgi:multidrug transporter EmrE-like cation transporter